MKKETLSVAIQQIEDAVTAARLCGSGTFTVNDVLARLPKQEKELPERVENLLESDSAFFSDGSGTYTGRAEFFTGGEFLITPDDREIEDGVLFPGHRFTAYVSPDVFPSDVVLIHEEDQSRVRRKTVTGTLAEIFHYHLLLGSEQVFDYFVAEHPENEALQDGPGADCPVKLNVFDLKKFYHSVDFAGGDALLCRVEDWQQGTIKFRYLPGDNRRHNDRAAWIDDCTDAIIEVINRFADYPDIPEQLAWTFFHGGKKLLTAPQGSLDELIRETRSVEIGLEGGHAHLIRQQQEDDVPVDAGTDMPALHCDHGCDHDGDHDHDHDHDCDRDHEHVHAAHDIPEGFGISRGETEDLGRLLRDIGLSHTPAEVDAYILDNCFYRELEYQDFYARCFGREQLDFADDAQEAIFHNFIEDRWEQLSGNYDRVADEIKAPVRSAVLEIVDERLEFFHALKQSGIAPDSLPETAFRQLASIGVYLDHLLRLLNSPAGNLILEEAEEMMEKLAGVAETQEAALAELQPLVL